MYSLTAITGSKKKYQIKESSDLFYLENIFLVIEYYKIKYSIKQFPLGSIKYSCSPDTYKIK